MAYSTQPAANAETAPVTETLPVVETPSSPSSGLALSRFEFETGKGNEGTKILMVEWDELAGGREWQPSNGSNGSSDSSAADWEVSWEGKTAVLQVRDWNADNGGNVRREYFLLPPGAPVPALVSIARKGGDTSPGALAPSVLRTMPMPAIFLAELGGGGEGAGRRGVLHTIWAKTRLAELETEIAAEMKTNGEGVGLEMAVQERQWIVDHFGLGPENGLPKPAALHILAQTPISPTSPRSPIGGRLGEKLRGLKLATSPAELAAATHAGKNAQPRTQTLIKALSPPDPSAQAISSLASGNGVVASLDAIVGTGLPTPAGSQSNDTTEEDLFALPMSPRSPEMKRSPFSLL